jgi:uncharacterized protein YbbC (DUF1343 family)
MSHSVRIGLEVLLDDPLPLLKGARYGLLMNQASVDSGVRYTCDVLAERFPGQLAALFSPQHGLWCEEQDNMIETGHSLYGPLGIPIHSLYSETRRPSAEMLQGLDCLVVDLQDVGTRVYTFIWTVLHCLEACADARIPVVVLDRPNPLGGEICEGPFLEQGFESFIGLAAIPMRHALTIGEMALLTNEMLGIGAEVHVVSMQGWSREMYFPETGCPWVAPSPNMPRMETAVVYPGQVLVEGTTLSEGRGTTAPFELVGAPYIEPDRLAKALADYPTPGLMIRPVRFLPTFNKWADVSCGGIALHYTDPAAVRSYATTIALFACLRSLYPDQFTWLQPPYEYEETLMPIDILSGSSQLRETLDSGGTSPTDVAGLAEMDAEKWQERVRPHQLYS